MLDLDEISKKLEEVKDYREKYGFISQEDNERLMQISETLVRWIERKVGYR